MALLGQAVNAVAGSRTFLQPTLTKQVVAEFTRLSRLTTLTPEPQTKVENLTSRELAILPLLTQAKSNKAIAATLNLTEGTVKNHMTSIMAKLGATDRTGAALRARELGF
jgi:DNA-binding NarL/FixJ family response regulator